MDAGTKNALKVETEGGDGDGVKKRKERKIEDINGYPDKKKE